VPRADGTVWGHVCEKKRTCTGTTVDGCCGACWAMARRDVRGRAFTNDHGDVCSRMTGPHRKRHFGIYTYIHTYIHTCDAIDNSFPPGAIFLGPVARRSCASCFSCPPGVLFLQFQIDRKQVPLTERDGLNIHDDRPHGRFFPFFLHHPSHPPRSTTRQSPPEYDHHDPAVPDYLLPA
jgi:hypothetical protein